MLRTISLATTGKRSISILILTTIILIMMHPMSVSGYAGLGQYISEKLLSRTGTGDSSLYLGSGSSGPTVLGSGPTISTGVATNPHAAGGTKITLSGTVLSLNGFPRADIWFEWGYDPSNLNNTSTVSTVTSTGLYSIEVIGWSVGTPVYYRFASSTDGTTRGSTSNFNTSGAGVDYWFMWNVLPLAVALVGLITVLKLTGNWPMAILIVVVTLIGVRIVKALMVTLW